MKTFLILLMFFGVGSSTRERQQPATFEVVVIINSKNPPEKLSLTEVRNYWMRKGAQKAWPVLKTDVKPVDHKGRKAEKTLFYARVIGLNEVDVDSYFAAKQYQSGENPPAKFASDAEVISYVSENSGAIGFVNKNSLPADNTSVKVIYSITE